MVALSVCLSLPRRSSLCACGSSPLATRPSAFLAMVRACSAPSTVAEPSSSLRVLPPWRYWQTHERNTLPPAPWRSRIAEAGNLVVEVDYVGLARRQRASSATAFCVSFINPPGKQQGSNRRAISGRCWHNRKEKIAR